MSNNTILFIWDGDYPWDIRVDKFCTALSEAGSEIHLICRNLARRPRDEFYKGIHLHRLPFLPRWLGRLNAAFTFPAFFSPIWLGHMYRHARAHSCDVIIVRDLPMAPAAVIIGWLTRRPVVMDMAECYPEMLRSRWKHQRRTLIDRVVRSPALAALVEKWVVRGLDAVLVVVQESKDRLVRMGLDPSRVFVVSNTPERRRFQNAAAPLGPSSDDRPLEIIYVGLVGATRGLDTAIDAVERYVKAGHEIILRIVGAGTQSTVLERVVLERRLDKYVVFEGWVDNSKVPELVARADAGLVPHHSTSHWQNTIPNKLFDYMAAGKPVIATRIAPVARVLEEANCGYLFDDYDVEGLTRIFGQLQDRAICRLVGARGSCAVTERYNWDSEKPVLHRALSRVTNTTAKNPSAKGTE